VRHRRLASLLAAVSVAGLAAAGCGSNANAAIRVEDQSISRRDFEASLDFVYENADMRRFLFGQDVPAAQLRPENPRPGVFTQQYVGEMGRTHVQFLLAEQLMADNDLSLSQDDRAAAEDQIGAELEDGIDTVPDDLRDIYVDGFAALNVVQDELDADELNQAAQDLLTGGDGVTVSSRYGSWDPDQFRIDPPAGPRPAPGSGPGADGTGLPAG
jgi:hypothetical protein